MMGVAFFSWGNQDLSQELRDLRDEQAALHADVHKILQMVRIIMADVKIAQADLDAAADALRALVTKLNETDFTPLPAADQSGIVSAVTDLTDVVNRITGPKIPDVPAPNPEPEPTPAPEPAPETPADGGGDTSTQ